MQTRTVAMMLTPVMAGLVIGCSSKPPAPTTIPVPVVRQIFPVDDIGRFLAQPNPKICPQCYLADADLPKAYLAGADLNGANLTGASLERADLDGVIGGDFSGAYNVPAK